MNIQNAARKLLYEPWRQQTHVSGEAYKIDLALLQRRGYFAVMLFAVFALGWNDLRFESELASDFKSGSIGAIGDYDCNSCVRNLSRSYVLRDRLEVRTAP